MFAQRLEDSTSEHIRSYTSEASLYPEAAIRKLHFKISRTLIKVMQGTCDMNKCQGRYFCMDQSSNKDIHKGYVKKDTQCSFKTMNIEVLGIFQRRISS